MVNSVKLSLGRVFRPDGQSQTIIHAFGLDVEIISEGKQYVAVFKPLEHMLAGVGEDENKALEDFVSCFTTLVDFRFEKGNVEDFLCQYFEGTVHALQPNFREDEEEVYKTLPVWQLPSSPLVHAI